MDPQQVALGSLGPTLRVLASCLHTLAPNQDHVPLRPALALVFALDPALSGELLAPAEWDRTTGMPAFLWLERALAEQRSAREAPQILDPARLARAEAADPQLAARVRARAALHAHLLREELLPSTHLTGVVRELKRHTLVSLTFDAIHGDGLWSRTCVDLQARAGNHLLGPVRVVEGARLELDAGLAHLLQRHLQTPLPLLREQLLAAVPAAPVRLTRGTIGPFWHAAITSSESGPVPDGFALHSLTEVLSIDVHTSSQRDPLAPPPPVCPPGYGWFRERRVAATPSAMAALSEWSRDFPGMLLRARMA